MLGAVAIGFYTTIKPTVSIGDGMENGATSDLARVEKPSPRPTTGTLEIDISTPGATLTLDGKLVGPAKGFRQDLPAGAHDIEIGAEGYETHRETVIIGAGVEKSAMITLARIVASPPPVQNACDLLVDPNMTQQAVLASDTEAAVQAFTRATADFPTEVRFYHLLTSAQENQSFTQAMTGPNPGSAQAYLALYPAGRFVDPVRTRLATFSPHPAPAPGAVVPAPAIETQEITRILKTELRRVGCYAGNIDGTWGRPASEALQRFNQLAGAKLNVQMASIDSISAVRDKTRRVCPPVVCPKGQRVEADHCSAITCPSGFALLANGRCAKRGERIEPVTQNRELVTPQPSQSGRCVRSSLGTYCE
jgi:hypothetical protein